MSYNDGFDILKSIIMTPYSCPNPPDEIGQQDANIATSTLDSLFSDRDLSMKMSKITNNLSRTMQLQKDRANNSKFQPKIANIALFKDLFMQPEVNIISVMQIDSIAQIHIEEMLTLILEQKIPGPRAGLALFKLFHELRITPEEFYMKLISIERLKDLNNDLYRNLFIRLCYSCYHLKLVPHRDLLRYIIDKFHPKYYEIFINEILSSFPILKYALTESRMKQEFKNHYAIKIFSSKTQMVQISTYSYFKDLDIFNELMSFLTPDVIDRVSKLIKTLKYIAPVQNVLIQNYPFEDINKTITAIKTVIQMSSKKDYKKLILNLCETIFSFNSSNTVQAFIIAEIITQMKVEFPLHGYIDLLRKHVDAIPYAESLSTELQERGVFSFERFMSYLNEDNSINASIFMNTPCVSQNKNTIESNIARAQKYDPSEEFEHYLKKFMTEMTFSYITIDEVLRLPPVIRYNVVRSIAEKNKNSSSLDILIEVNYFGLAIGLLFDIGKKPVNSNILPLKQIFEYKLNQMEKPIPQYYRDLLDPIMFSKHYAIEFFQKHSSYCSLQVYNAILQVNDQHSFKTIIGQFLKDLLAFPGASADDIAGFIWDFSYSVLIDNPKDFIIKTFLSILFENREKSLCFRCKSLCQIFERLFEWKLMTPYSLIHKIIADPFPEVENILMNCLFKLITSRSNLFSLSDFLNPKFVDDVLQLEGQELSTLIELISKHLNHCAMPIDINRNDGNKQMGDQSVASANYASFIYSILPEKLRQDDFNAVFEYFLQNVSWQNVDVWCSWLVNKPCYRMEGRIYVSIVPNRPDDHYQKLVSLFQNLFQNSSLGETSDLIKYAWVVVCQDEHIAKCLSLIHI